MNRLRGQLRSLVLYAKVMRSPLDLYHYARLRMLSQSGQRSGDSARARQLRLRSLGGASIVCRPTQDVWTLKATFLDQFHLPPIDLPERALIVDLGSNVGYTVAHMAHLYPTACIIGVELDQRNFELAIRNTAHFGARVQLIHAGIWVSDGTVTYTGEEDDAFHVSAPGDPDTPEPGNVMTAPAKRLTTLFEELEIEEVDYLKMDIEGAEATILSGDMEWCYRVHSMKIEVHPPATLDSCRAALETRGFRCWRDERHWNCLCAVRD